MVKIEMRKVDHIGKSQEEEENDGQDEAGLTKVFSHKSDSATDSDNLNFTVINIFYSICLIGLKTERRRNGINLQE